MSLAGPNRAGWYRQSFGDLYPLIYAHRSRSAADREIRALARWAPLGPGDSVLDACCGGGRHLAAMVNLGCNAVGFDLSGELIRHASEDAVLAGRVFQADIRRIPLRYRFDRVVNLFTSFGYFPDDSVNADAFEALVRRVDAGGVLLLDHMNASRIRRTLTPESETSRAGYRIVQRRRIRGQRVQKQIDVIRHSDGRRWTFHEDVRMYEPVEIIEMARRAGLIDVTLHGSFEGEPYGPDSERMIVRARRDASRR